MNKKEFSLDRIAKLINSGPIAGQLIGAEIIGFKLEPIKGKKTLMRLTILTDAKRKPILRIEDMLKSANLIDYFDHYDEYDLSVIRLNVKLIGDWR